MHSPFLSYFDTQHFIYEKNISHDFNFVGKKFIGASARKSWEKSRIFRYGLSEHFMCKRQNTIG